MTTTVSTAMKENQHRAFRMLAVSLSFVVYVAGLVYAGVRSYTLFASTIDAALLPLAVVGIVALEVSAVALPLAIHFWTQPGAQRMTAIGFYVADMMLIASNAILDAAHHSGAEVSSALAAYGIYGVPALPLFCMAGWSLIWLLDASSRERDMRESVKAATHEALLSRIAEAVGNADITASVESAAQEAARALVGETLGAAPKRSASHFPVNRVPATVSYNATADSVPAYGDDSDTGEFQPIRMPSRNGKHAPKGAA
ncbi:MAG: hypothetical protein FJ030_16755 [Chloroflexi bacterium]|nr:hypothetical protein [Chloroflexota bacterium]